MTMPKSKVRDSLMTAKPVQWYLAVLLGFAANPVTAPAQETLLDARAEGQWTFGLRYRYEAVDQENLQRDAEASTLRTRLSYATGTVNGFSAFIEMDDVSQIGVDDYNSTRNGLSQFPVIADPEGTSVNQAYLRYRGEFGHQLTIGRQRINLDNQRFVGGVAWRQNEQTFDALTWNYQGSDTVSASYSYVDKVNRIFGPDRGTPTKHFDSESHLANLKLAKLPFGALSAYGYWLDFDNAPALSSQTYGLRATGKFERDQGVNWAYQLEWATQDDFGDNPTPYSADYQLLELSGSFARFQTAIGMEILQGDSENGAAFRTPLATLHKFQGFSDRFLNTPNNGIEDLYVSVGTKLSGVNLRAIYHQFDSEQGSTSYGDELNLLLTRSFGRYGALLVKYSDYDADEFSVDGSKWWIQYSFSIK